MSLLIRTFLWFGVATLAVGQGLPAAAQDPVSSSWVARYASPNQGNELARAIATDRAGNVYVTGQSADSPGNPANYITAKYDKDGNQLWVATYNGPGNGSDRARALALDTAGNVYVTGHSWGGAGTGSDYATIKYDTNGNQLWVARYNAFANSSDSATDLAIDTAGNVVVTGDSFSDYVTVKYDPDGNRLWVARYVEAGGQTPAALALDSAGNVAVTGFSTNPSGTDIDIVTVKYDPDGNPLWAARYARSNTVDTLNFARDLAIDDAGNVYVAGYVTQSGVSFSSFDYVTIKYGPTGNRLWVAHYDSTGTDFGYALVVDRAGNVYIAGESAGDFGTVKYDKDGNQLWVRRYDGLRGGFGGFSGFDEATALALDTAGNVYVAGSSLGVGVPWNLDYVVIQYDPDGTTLWTRRYNGPGNDSDRVNALTVDEAGNVYVTGTSGGGVPDLSLDYATLKFAASDPLPRLVRLDPRAVAAGSGAFPLTVTGTGFVPGSTIYWNGVPRATTYVSANQLTVNIAAADVATTGKATVLILNPAPGGGESNKVTLRIGKPSPPATLPISFAGSGPSRNEPF